MQPVIYISNIVIFSLVTFSCQVNSRVDSDVNVNDNSSTASNNVTSGEGEGSSQVAPGGSLDLTSINDARATVREETSAVRLSGSFSDASADLSGVVVWFSIQKVEGNKYLNSDKTNWDQDQAVYIDAEMQGANWIVDLPSSLFTHNSSYTLRSYVQSAGKTSALTSSQFQFKLAEGKLVRELVLDDGLNKSEVAYNLALDEAGGFFYVMTQKFNYFSGSSVDDLDLQKFDFDFNEDTSGNWGTNVSAFTNGNESMHPRSLIFHNGSLYASTLQWSGGTKHIALQFSTAGGLLNSYITPTGSRANYMTLYNDTLYQAGGVADLVSGTSNQDWSVRKFDLDLTEDTAGWPKGGHSTGTQGDVAIDIAVDASGIYLVAEFGFDGGGNVNEMRAIKMDHSGVVQWSKLIGIAANGLKMDQISIVGSEIWVVGWLQNTISGTSAQDGYLKVYDSATGNEVVTKSRTMGSDKGDDRIQDVLYHPQSSSVFLAGFYYNQVDATTGKDVIIRRILNNNTFDPNWNIDADFSGNDDDVKEIIFDSQGDLWLLINAEHYATPTSNLDPVIRIYSGP